MLRWSRPFVLVLASLVSLSAPSYAASVPLWAVEQGSRLGFSASMSGAVFKGNFARWTAQIRFDPANLAGSSAVVQIATASARTGDASRDEALPTDDWFAVRAFPTATFRSTRIRSLGGGRYVADGQLSIRGTARAISLPFTLQIAGNRAVMRGSLAIDRTVFGVGQGQFAGNDPVTRSVRIDIALNARKLP